MDVNYQPDNAMKAGTAGGMLLALLMKLDAASLLETAVVAAVGAVISFGVSVLLKWALRKIRR